MKNCWLTSDSICVAMGDAVALNLMFETRQDHKLFFKCWKKYLGEMANLLNYHLSPTGWILLFKTKSKEEILDAYHDLRSQSKKAKKENELNDVSRILSEHFRIFLSQYVRRSNAKYNRKGTRVMQRFHKYILRESSNYEYLFDKITARFKEPSQPKKRYQADESQYDINKEMVKESVWKVGTRVYEGLEEGFRMRFGLKILRPKSSVLRNFFNSYNMPNPPPILI